ncbi:hypothetical protein DXN04_13310 [Chitinophaga silvisoli]|uniref:Uncharacterized protein n=1 Tax=Chitinophaga silvisoli TaxID=2291814 RepID=A0A3E1P269_9BACT|nr:hypothetical protein DXN04_13310 [Chitinophaga silvisoli]
MGRGHGKGSSICIEAFGETAFQQRNGIQRIKKFKNDRCWFLAVVNKGWETKNRTTGACIKSKIHWLYPDAG